MEQNFAVTANGEITFYAWMICRYLGQPTPISDIAFDMAFDKNWPLDNKYTSIRNHLGIEEYADPVRSLTIVLYLLRMRIASTLSKIVEMKRAFLSESSLCQINC